MIDRLSLVQSPCTTSGQETERVHSYNPGARTGRPDVINRVSYSVQRTRGVSRNVLYKCTILTYLLTIMQNISACFSRLSKTSYSMQRTISFKHGRRCLHVTLLRYKLLRHPASNVPVVTSANVLQMSVIGNCLVIIQRDHPKIISFTPVILISINFQDLVLIPGLKAWKM